MHGRPNRRHKRFHKHGSWILLWCSPQALPMLNLQMAVGRVQLVFKMFLIKPDHNIYGGVHDTCRPSRGSYFHGMLRMVCIFPSSTEFPHYPVPCQIQGRLRGFKGLSFCKNPFALILSWPTQPTRKSAYILYLWRWG